MAEVPRITVGELIDQLKAFPPDWELTFADELTFYRLKRRGDALLQVEFNESIWKDRQGKWHVDA